MKFYVYVLDSKVKNYMYVGLTGRLEKRLKEHQDGKNFTTKPYRPFKVLLIEEYPTRADARKREKYLKSGAGKEFLKT
jgi:putative endonuclease